ncbi:MAG TPA: nuclear transport factor 2 family protein [Tepidisphaeraceae bacterium]|jgi:hypothetical protein|nr:nuclear transport factor 2 family protein [Tepidisphaeraceae bacterium]
MKSIFFSVSLLIALLAGTLRAADDAAVTALKSADDMRVAATLAADPAKLSAVLSDELRYAHSTGAVDTKASLIQGLTSGRLKYVQYEYQERNFKLAGPGVALMTGRANVTTGGAKGSEMVLGFLAVWREEAGQWRFLAWQSCRLNPSPAATK